MQQRRAERGAPQMATVAASSSKRRAEGLDDDEKYAFDTGGYVVLRGLLTPEEVRTCNDAIDAMTEHEGLIGSESYSGDSPLMRGRNNLYNRLARKIATLRPGSDVAAVADAVHAAAAAAPQAGRGRVPIEELGAVLGRYELDGWALSAEQVQALMGAAEQLSGEGFEPITGKPHRVSESADGLISVGCSNWRISGQLSWPQPYCEPFRELLCHPRLQSALDSILGKGYRLDHGPCAFSEGRPLAGAPIVASMRAELSAGACRRGNNARRM